MVEVPWDPVAMLRELGEAERLKFGEGATVNGQRKRNGTRQIAARAVDGDGERSNRAELLAVSVNVPVEEVAAGLKLAATPVGRPEADNATEELKPLGSRTITRTICAAARPGPSSVGYFISRLWRVDRHAPIKENRQKVQ